MATLRTLLLVGAGIYLALVAVMYFAQRSLMYFPETLRTAPAQAGLPLRPTELLIFGNAKAGTPLMQANQAIGIDLPLKALVFEDAAGKVWLSYNDPRWLAHRHGLGAAAAETVNAMAAALNGAATKATKPP